MYKLILADDEKIIRDGIAKLINWDELDIALVGLAENGQVAYEMIVDSMPDIVIIDIKMPGMNGFELIEAVKARSINTEFIILSGYEEFDFAVRAMHFEIKHYLLKPCTEIGITKILKEVINDIKKKEERRLFFDMITQSFDKAIPIVKEQFLRDFIMTGVYSKHDYKFFMDLFNLKDKKFKLILFNIEKKCDYIDILALQNISIKVLQPEAVFLSTIIEDNVLILIKTMDLDKISGLIEEIRKIYYEYCENDISVAISEEGYFENISLMYDEVKYVLKYRFYLNEGCILTKTDFQLEKGGDEIIKAYDYSKVAGIVKTGNLDALNCVLTDFFDWIRLKKFDIDISKTYCMELFLFVIRQDNSEFLNNHLKNIILLQEMNTLNKIQEFINTTAYDIAKRNNENITRKHSILVQKTIEYINKNINNSELSLSWLAKNVFFVNEDYIGKVFHKETNERFSQYVLRLRMEKAKELIESKNNYMIYEIAELTGFSGNSQYFSQVFKKYTGYSPKEYKNRI